MKKDVSLHYQKTNKMDYLIEKIDRSEIRKKLKYVWTEAYEFLNSNHFKSMEQKEKRSFNKIEKDLWNLYKIYYNDMLQQKSDTTERTIDI